MPHGQSAGTVGAHLKDVWQQVQEDGLTAAVLLAQGLEESVDVQAAELGPARVCVCGGEGYCPTIPPSSHHPTIPLHIVQTLWPEASPALLVSAHCGHVGQPRHQCPTPLVPPPRHNGTLLSPALLVSAHGGDIVAVIAGCREEFA